MPRFKSTKAQEKAAKLLPAKVAKAKGFDRDGEERPAVTVHVRPVICKNCKSPRRKQYRDGRLLVQDFDSMMFDPVLKVHYNRIILRTTECLDCGQRLRVKEFTFKPEKV